MQAVGTSGMAGCIGEAERRKGNVVIPPQNNDIIRGAGSWWTGGALLGKSQ